MIVDRLPLDLSQASGVPYYRQVVDQVADLIRSGQLTAGERLPSVRELAAQLLVSLITVRRAYDELENAGLIVRRQGQGTFVGDDVRAASRRRALTEARNRLAEAVTTARQLGLEGAELRSCLEQLLEQKGGEHE